MPTLCQEYCHHFIQLGFSCFVIYSLLKRQGYTERVKCEGNRVCSSILKWPPMTRSWCIGKPVPTTTSGSRTQCQRPKSAVFLAKLAGGSIRSEAARVQSVLIWDTITDEGLNHCTTNPVQ